MMKTWRKIDFFRINLSIILAHEMEINISQTLRRLKLDQKLTSIRLAASFFPLTLISLFFVYSKIKPNIRKLIPQFRPTITVKSPFHYNVEHETILLNMRRFFYSLTRFSNTNVCVTINTMLACFSYRVSSLGQIITCKSNSVNSFEPSIHSATVLLISGIEFL